MNNSVVINKEGTSWSLIMQDAFVAVIRRNGVIVRIIRRADEIKKSQLGKFLMSEIRKYEAKQ